MTARRRGATFAALAMLCLAAGVWTGPARAQLVLNAPLERYTIRSFRYSPPAGQGWRSTEMEANGLNFVFAERTVPGAINIRADITLEAFDVPAGSAVPSARALTELARGQQAAERKQSLVSSTEVSTVPGRQGLQTYSLVSKIGEVEIHEVFFVLLSPDRSSYLVAKFATKEPGYRDELYWAQFYGALSSLGSDG